MILVVAIFYRVSKILSIKMFLIELVVDKSDAKSKDINIM